MCEQLSPLPTTPVLWQVLGLLLTAIKLHQLPAPPLEQWMHQALGILGFCVRGAVCASWAAVSLGSPSPSLVGGVVCWRLLTLFQTRALGGSSTPSRIMWGM